MVGQGSYSSGSPIVKEVEHNCPPLPCGLCIGTFFQRAQYGKGGSVTFTLQSRNLARTTSAEWSRSTSCWQHAPLIWCEENGTSALWSFSPKPITTSNHEKNIREIPLEGQSTKRLTRNPQNCQGHQKQEKCEKLSQRRGAWENLTTK